MAPTSDMLEKAIIDATTLKEVALKNAENVLVEKYSEKLREAVEKILEQPQDEEEEEEDLDLGDLDKDISSEDTAGLEMMGGEEGNQTNVKSDISSNIPLASSEGEKLCPCPDDDEEIEIDFSELARQMQNDDLSSEDMLGREETAEELPIEKKEEEEDDDLMKEEKNDLNNEDEKENGEEDEKGENDNIDEQINLDEIELENIISDELNFDDETRSDNNNNDNNKEEINFNSVPVSDGWLGSTPSEKQEFLDIIKALKSLKLSEETKEKSEEKETNKIQLENKKLKEEYKNIIKENKELKSLLGQLKNTLEEINIKNIRLFYKNKALNSISLNERQKKQIVEAIDKVDSLKQAKLVFETLQSAVGNFNKSNKKIPKSLREAVERSSSALFKQKNGEDSDLQQATINPYLDRMKYLAGIKK